MHRFLLVISVWLLAIFSLSNMWGMDLSCFSRIDNDKEFCDSIERLMPKLTEWRKTELDMVRKQVPTSMYANACLLYTKKYQAGWVHNKVETELRCDSILIGSLLYFLRDKKARDEGVIKLIADFAERMNDNGYEDFSQVVCQYALGLCEENDIYDKVYGNLRSLENVLRFDEDPARYFRTQKRLLSIFKRQYEEAEGMDRHYLHQELIDHYVCTVRLALRGNFIEQADSVVQEAMDFIYDRKGAAKGHYSVIVPTNPHMIRSAKYRADIAFAQGKTHRQC